MANANEIILKLTADNQQLKAKLEESKKAVDKTTNDIEKSGSKLTSVLKSMGTVVAGYLGVQLVKNLANTAKEVNEVSKGFENLAVSAEGGAQGLLKAMKTASKGTMAELEMMKSANLAIQLMGEDVIQYLPKMAEISAGVAKAQGVEASQMLNDMVRAAGRQSVMILDNLGVSSVRAGQLMEEYASKLGKTRDQLTESEKSAAFFYATMKAGEEVLQRSGGVTEDFSTKLQRFNANLKNLTDNIAKLLLPILDKLVTVLDKIVSSIQDAIDKYNEFSALVDTGKVDVAGQWTKEAIEGSKWYKEQYEQIKKLYEDKYQWEKRNQELLQKGWTQQELNAKKNELINKEIYERFYKMTTEQQKQAIFGISKKQVTKTTSTSITAALQTGEGTYVNYAKEFEEAAKKVAEGFEKVRAAAEEGKLDEVARQMKELQQQGLLTANANSQFVQSMQTIAVQAKAQNYAVDTLSTAFTNLDNASRDAVYEMLWGKNGWNNFLKNFKEIVKQLVAEIVYLTVKAMALQAVLSAVGIFGFGGGGVGARVLSKIFERGYIPSYARGKIPAFPTGYVPNDHFLAYIGTKEAVIRKEATQANRDILAWMNANNGQRYQNDILLTSIVQIDGNEVGRAVDRYRDNVQSLTGLKNYSRKQL